MSPTLSTPPEHPPSVHNKPADGSLSISIKCKTSSDIDDGYHEELKLELQSEFDDVEEESDRSGWSE